MNKKKVFAAGLALTVLFGGQATQSFAATETNPVKVASSEYTYSEQAVKALNYLNDIRAKMGLQPAKLNPFLTKAAENHANYISLSRDYEHNEDPTKKGFTGEWPSDRVKAVGGSDELRRSTWEIISFHTNDVTRSIDTFLNTAYHRGPLIDPDTTDIGVGVSGNNIVIDGASLANTKQVSMYPYNGQKNVGIGFYGFEDPNPLENFGVDISGQIITIRIPQDLSGIDAVLKNSKGENVPFFEPLQDAAFWHIFPKKELDYNETYTVSVSYTPVFGTDKGKTFTETWSFTTESNPHVTLPGGQTGGKSGGKSSGKDDGFVTYTPIPSETISAIQYSSKNIGIKINGKYVTINPKAKLVNGSTFIPLRGVFEALNAEVKWNSKDQSVDIKKGNTKVHLKIGSKKATVNGKTITLTTAPFISEEGSTYVPLRFASEALGAQVVWDADNWTVVIDSK